MNLELAGKACLVAGASRGIGREIAIALAREGASVIGAARGADDLAQLAADLGEAGGGPHATVVADVSTATGADTAIAAAITSFGRLDIVVANVGKSFARDALQMDDDDLAKSLDTNLWSAARVAQRARPHLESTRGSITMIASIWGRESGGAPGYNVAKAGVVALAKALAHDYARFGIRVNSVAPGSILFPGGGWERRMKADPAAIAAMVERELPFGRFGTPAEVANVVAFVASPRASWISGACVVVDGAQSHAF